MKRTHLVDIIVPVLGRPEAARRFVSSLGVSGCGHRVHVTAVADATDPLTRVAWEDEGVDVMVLHEPPGTFARKVNLAYRWTAAPWLLLVGDDVAFHRGWLDACLRVAGATQAQVIGTNDNGWRADGNNAVHPLIARSYVDRQGASWDGPGVVCHEGYRHNYVDAEVHMVAHDRGVFAPAQDAVIEHLHHSFHRAPVDATYELGTRALNADAALYRRRMAAHRSTNP